MCEREGVKRERDVVEEEKKRIGISERILIASDDQGIAEQVIRLLRDDDLHQSISSAGVSFIEDGYRWDQQLNRYRELIAGVVKSGRRQ